MAPAKKPRRREAQIAFEAIAIEGGLLSPDWLARVAQLDAGGQAEADYRVPKGLNLRDEIGRYWRIAQAHWADFAAGQAAGAEPQALADRFVQSLLRDSLGFASLKQRDPEEINGRIYPVRLAAIDGLVPIVVAPAANGCETPSTAFGDGSRRRSAFGLVQEYLNAAEGARWGVASDGATLRIARDNASLTRPAWIEADLARIFTEERYADFAALWLLGHETRFGATGQPLDGSPLERWRITSREEGTPARERLRRCVQEALLALGQGFRSHPENQALRKALQDGSLTKNAFFQELLRLVYRLIFLLTIEERGLLHPDGVSEDVKRLYAEGYGMARLRDRSVRRSAHDRFSDVWEGVKIVFRGLSDAESRLGLPALAGIFASRQCPTLDASKLENRALLLAVFRLAWLRESSGLARVNWRDMGPEELGSVYESLLELVPQITADGREFSFASGGEAKGHARKTTGSYYTPDSLVQVLLDSALEPVVRDTIAAHPDDPVAALLQLSIVDPACGSGHFLLAAARRLATHVARLQASGTPSAAEYRRALRQVIARCIYGVDLNPMAVELCKVSLWMEAVDPGLPLTFLDSHIQYGNALLGTTPELMAGGIPDAAWDPIEGDDRRVASALKKRNKAERVGQQGLHSMWSEPAGAEQSDLTAAVAALDIASDSDASALGRKESRWQEILSSPTYGHQKLAADAWCAAFVWPKQPGQVADAAPTNLLWKQLYDSTATSPTVTASTVIDLSGRYTFFHWHLQFPQVFARGGFDIVLGNPPWDSLLFQEEEFFARTRPDIALASTAAARKKLIGRLETEDSKLFAEYRAELRKVDGINGFVRSAGRFPLCGVGRVNLFALFAETARTLVGKRGRVGQILPSGIVFDDSTKLFFQSVVEQGELVSFYDFENREGIFEAVHRSFKFGLLTIAEVRGPSAEAEFVFFATRIDDLKQPERRFTLSAEDIALLNPATKTCPIFRSRYDAQLVMEVYRRLPVLMSSGWSFEVRRFLNSADDSERFVDSPGIDRLPLYEGKHFWHFDHRWSTNVDGVERRLTERESQDPQVSVQPRYWYPELEVRSRFGSSWNHSWVFAIRKITNATNERTFVAAVIPSLAVSDSAKVLLLPDARIRNVPALAGVFASFVWDFIARQKLGGSNMSAYIVEQLPLPTPSDFEAQPAWADRSFDSWSRSRAIELTYVAWDLESFAHDIGCDGPPFRSNVERRFLLRCELDAALFHLYGLSRNEVDYVMDAFPIVRKNDEKAYGEYCTKRVILEIYDDMAAAARTGKPYMTRLNPPPADARVAHPDTRVQTT